jgi:ABC-type branched-subunit amino acid transport system substrate-binding protein
MKRQKFAAITCVASILLLAAACGDDDDTAESATADAPAATDAPAETDAPASTDAPAATDAPATTTAATEPPDTGGDAPAEETRGVSDTSIKVGGVVPKVQGFNYEDMCTGAQVVFDKVNEAGGVNGRTIEFVDCRDDQATPDVNIQEVTRLIEQDEVFAVVPASPVMAGSTIAVDANVPFFGWGINPYFCDNDQGFSFNGCTGPNDPAWENRTWAKLLMTADPSISTVAMIGHDIPAGKVNMDAISRGAELEGLEIVYSDTSIPLAGVTDWTPYVQGIIESGADAVMIQVQQALPLIAALKAGGYEGVTQNAVAYDPRTLQDEAGAQALEGQYLNVQFVPFESDDPAIQTMVDDVATYAGDEQLLTVALGQGYLSALMFVQMLEQAGATLTYDSFFDVANGGFTFDGDGMVGSITYPDGHASYSGCEALVQVVDGAFVEAVPLTCAGGVGQIGALPG